MKAHRKLTVVEMVEKFQCVGCLYGPGPASCEKYGLYENGGFAFCQGHVAATFMTGAGRLALGLPKGFNRYGEDRGRDPETLAKTAVSRMLIRLHPERMPSWDRLNVPVWKMVQEGFLFVRTYAPRTNYCFVDVVQSTEIDAPALAGAIDVGTFYDAID